MDVLKKLPSPVGLSREEILEILCREQYGYIPPRPISVKTEVIEHIDHFYGEKSSLDKLLFTIEAPFGSYSFPITYSKLLNTDKPVPAFIHLNFRPDVPDKYQPTEEILDQGFNILTIYYQAVTSDDAYTSAGDFTNGLAGVLYPDGKRGLHDAGKLMLWAYAASAVMDYAMTLPELDHERVTVIGHSRLGKTALLTGAIDPRFFCAISNDSGASGAAIARDKEGETVAKITTAFPFWFCENYKKYANREDELPFDQHYLLAANADHLVYVASAVKDLWASPKNEYLSCVAASDYFVSVGRAPFVHPDRLPEVGECFHEGDIGYHMREGIHTHSRTDWNAYIAFLKKHM